MSDDRIEYTWYEDKPVGKDGKVTVFGVGDYSTFRFSKDGLRAYAQSWNPSYWEIMTINRYVINSGMGDDEVYVIKKHGVTDNALSAQMWLSGKDIELFT